MNSVKKHKGLTIITGIIVALVLIASYLKKPTDNLSLNNSNKEVLNYYSKSITKAFSDRLSDLPQRIMQYYRQTE